MAYILGQCVEKGEFTAIQTTYNHPTMVEDGLLEEVGKNTYKLTKKAIGLLYTVYGV